MYTCEILTEEELQQFWDDGIILEMYKKSKPYITGGTFSYPYQQATGISLAELNAESNDENLAEWWKEVFKQYICYRDNNSYAYTTYEDGYPLIIDVGNYEPEDQSWNHCNSLLRPNTSNSKEYLFNVHYQNCKAEEYKKLGAVRQHIYVDDGPMADFFQRMKTAGAQKEGSLVDWANQTVTSISVPYIFKTGGGKVIPTVDGSGIPDLVEPEVVIAEYTCDYKKLSMEFI
jgi:hypothetical protein